LILVSAFVHSLHHQYYRLSMKMGNWKQNREKTLKLLNRLWKFSTFTWSLAASISAHLTLHLWKQSYHQG